MHLEKSKDENIPPISVLFSPFFLATDGKNVNIILSAQIVRNCKHRTVIRKVLCLVLESCDSLFSVGSKRGFSSSPFISLYMNQSCTSCWNTIEIQRRLHFSAIFTHRRHICTDWKIFKLQNNTFSSETFCLIIF